MTAASAHHFPTPGHGGKGVVGSDHSRPRALLQALASAVRVLTNFRIVF
jgi:hypothetical protein